MNLEETKQKLQAMRDRLQRQIGEQANEAYESMHRDGDGVHMHTHNADMDVEGLDEAVGVSHALEARVSTVDRLLQRLNSEGEQLLKNSKERERIDALLATESFAEELRNDR